VSEGLGLVAVGERVVVVVVVMLGVSQSRYIYPVLYGYVDWIWCSASCCVALQWWRGRWEKRVVSD
jgi:hypothetical protein